MTAVLELGFHMASRKIVFRNRQDAEVEMLKIKPLIGKWDKNDRAHTIDSPCGPVVVDIDKVEFVAVIDTDVYDDVVASAEQKSQDNEIAYQVRMRTALAAIPKA